MNGKVQFISFLVAAFVGIVATRDLPDFIHVCNRNDPNKDACITDSVEFLRPYLKKGVPEYNIPSLEPLILKELVAAQGRGLKITAKNVRAYGASNFVVTKLKVDLNKLRFAVDVDLPNLHIEGHYEVDGKVLLLPITGSGPMNGNFSAVKGAAKIQLMMDKRADGNFLKITDFKMKILIGKGNLKLDNLFGGEKVLGDVINTAINNNFDTFMKELQPLIEAALSEAFLDLGNNILGQFTFEQLFPTS